MSVTDFNAVFLHYIGIIQGRFLDMIYARRPPGIDAVAIIINMFPLVLFILILVPAQKSLNQNLRDYTHKTTTCVSHIVTVGTSACN